MEELRDVSGERIEAGQVRTLSQVTVDAGEGHVVEQIRATMFPRDDVLELERRKWRVVLVELAVLAAASRTSPHLGPGCLGHSGDSGLTILRACRCKMAMNLL